MRDVDTLEIHKELIIGHNKNAIVLLFLNYFFFDFTVYPVPEVIILTVLSTVLGITPRVSNFQQSVPWIIVSNLISS